MYTHACLRCKHPYRDEDPDPYYCQKCTKAVKKIAAIIDKKIHPAPRVPTLLEQYDAAQGKKRGFVPASFFNL